MKYVVFKSSILVKKDFTIVRSQYHIDYCYNDTMLLKISGSYPTYLCFYFYEYCSSNEIRLRDTSMTLSSFI